MGIEIGVKLHPAADTSKTMDNTSHSSWCENIFGSLLLGMQVLGFLKTNSGRKRDKQLDGSEVDIGRTRHPVRVDAIRLCPQYSSLASKIRKWDPLSYLQHAVISSSMVMIEIEGLRHMSCHIVYTNGILPSV